MDSDSQTLQAVPRCNSPECSVDRCTFSGPANLDRWNSHFAKLAASARVESALRHLPGPHVLSSSFGAQAAVSLHMLTRHQPDIPIILADTGYLFPETYQFIDELTDRLNLNLHVVRSVKSPAWQEQRHGQRWLQGVDGIDAYNFDNKVEPVQRALNDLKVATWFSGIRRNQALSRAATPFVQYAGGRFKVCPIADWTDRDVYDYLKANELPYHPLWEKGYVSIGDVHTTRALHEVEDESETRFFGLKRECGLHDKML